MSDCRRGCNSLRFSKKEQCSATVAATSRRPASSARSSSGPMPSVRAISSTLDDSSVMPMAIRNVADRRYMDRSTLKIRWQLPIGPLNHSLQRILVGGRLLLIFSRFGLLQNRERIHERPGG